MAKTEKRHGNAVNVTNSPFTWSKQKWLFWRAFKVVFNQKWLLINQSEQFKNYSKSSDWLEKSRLSKEATFIL